MLRARCWSVVGFLFLLAWVASGCSPLLILPEQTTINVRDPAQLPHAKVPEVPPPATVSDPQPKLPVRYLTLDEAIRIALANSKVVRLLAGTSAVSSGVTIYDPAISNTFIDQKQ